MTNTQPTNTGSGFFGKLPTHGDFVTRRLSRAILDPWDTWLQKAVARSQECLGEHWLHIYLTSPIWRFYLSKGICADKPILGLLMPSVDKVGRYFPLTIMHQLQEGHGGCHAAFANDDWYEQVEQIALTALDDSFELDQFDAQVERCVPGYDGDAKQPPAERHQNGSIHVVYNAMRGSAAPGAYLLNHFLTSGYTAKYSVWWCKGSERMHPGIIACSGLPPIDGFTAFLDGQWSYWGWQNNSGNIQQPTNEVNTVPPLWD